MVVEEDLGGFADYMAAGDWVATGVGRVRGRERGYLGGE